MLKYKLYTNQLRTLIVSIGMLIHSICPLLASAKIEDPIIPNLSRIAFTGNHGQLRDYTGKVRPDVLFMAEEGPVKIYFTKSGINYSWVAHESTASAPLNFTGRETLRDEFEQGLVDQVTSYAINMSFLGASPNVTIAPEQPLPGTTNYYKGDDPLGICDVRSYRKLTYKNIYPSIDLAVYSQENKIKYDFIVHPGGDPSIIQMDYQGHRGLGVTPEGRLKVTTPLGVLIEEAPYTYQLENNLEIGTKFSLTDHGFTFDVEEYDTNTTLIIDPQVIWSTYYGNAGFDLGYNMVRDAAGNTYMVGWTESTAGIASSGHQNTHGGDKDAYLVKFNTAGQRVWATYYGGTGEDRARGVTVDNSGNVYVVGNTASTTGIATAGAYQTTLSGGGDGFIAKFNSNGTRQWATYIGGSEDELLTDIAINSSNELNVVGRTASSDLTTLNAHQSTFGGGDFDGLVLSLDLNGAPSWISFFGGNDSLGDHIFKLGLDNNDNLYFGGLTASTANVSNGLVHQSGYGGGSFDAFLTSMDAGGTLRWSSYYGGTGIDAVLGLVVDVEKAEIYLSGNTSSTTGISTLGADQTAFGGGSDDGFLAKFDENGNLLWGTYVGGEGKDKGRSVALSKYGVFITGVTTSTTNIATTGGETPSQPTIGGAQDAYLIKYNKSGIKKWGTYHGGDRRDLGYGLEIDENGNITMIGKADRGLGLAGTGYQSDYQNFGDIFIVKYSESFIDEPTVPASNLTITNLTSTSIQIDWAPGNGDARLVVIRQNRPVNRAPVDNTTYAYNTNFRLAPNLGARNRVVYSGTCNSVIVTGLRPGRTYHVAVYEYNALGDGTEDYLATNPATGSTVAQPGAGSEPTVPASGVVITNVTSNSMDVSWTNGNGQARVVVAMPFFNVFNFPQDGITYAANNNYNLGQNIGFFHRIVYNGTGNSFTLTGLNAGWTYTVAVFEYNGTVSGTEDYLTTNPGRGSATTNNFAAAAASTGPGIASTTTAQAVNIASFQNSIVVSFDNVSSAPSVTTVYDLNGQQVVVVDNRTNTQESLYIPLTDVSKPYIVKVANPQGVTTRKIFIRQ